MIKYRKNSLWGFNRQFKKSPHKALLNLEVTAEEAVYFKLKGQTFLFCHFAQLHEHNVLDASDHQPLSLRDSQQISSFKLLNSDFSFQSSAWLSTLQRFLAVALTQQIESQNKAIIDVKQIIQAPLEWTLFHLSIQCDLRKATRTRDQHALKIIEDFQKGLESPYTRLFSSVHGFNSWRLSHRKLSKQLLQFKTSGLSLSVEDCYAFVEWKQHLSETITWALLMLENRPELMKELKSELAEVLLNQSYQIESLFKLPKLFCFINETLRCFPPAWLSLWGQIKDFQDNLDLFPVVKGGLNPQTVILSTPLHSHFNQLDWPSPYSFQPERFLGVFYGAQAPKSFLPFGPLLEGHTLSLISLHTIAAVLSSILRRGKLCIESTSWEPLQFPMTFGQNYVDEWIGAGFGVPPHLKGRFTLDESYVYIPSARI